METTTRALGLKWRQYDHQELPLVSLAHSYELVVPCFCLLTTQFTNLLLYYVTRTRSSFFFVLGKTAPIKIKKPSGTHTLKIVENQGFKSLRNLEHFYPCFQVSMQTLRYCFLVKMEVYYWYFFEVSRYDSVKSPQQRL